MKPCDLVGSPGSASRNSSASVRWSAAMRTCTLGAWPTGHRSITGVPPPAPGRIDELRGQATVNISVFGLGYVGTVCAGCLSARGHTVIGVDVNRAKVESINIGVAPIVEPEIPALIRRAHDAKRLWATTRPLEAIQAS